MFKTIVDEIQLETLQRCEGAEDPLPVSLARSYEVLQSHSFGSDIQKRDWRLEMRVPVHKESPQLAFQVREVQKRQEAPVHVHPEKCLRMTDHHPKSARIVMNSPLEASFK